jgi:hypothetical protein
MARKRNPENDLVVTPSAAASRPRRTTTAARPKHSPTTADTAESELKSEMEASAASSGTGREPSHEEVRALAHSYWLARGCQGGSPEEDWRRAEEELRLQSLVTAL